jgi:hypothetical protein
MFGLSADAAGRAFGEILAYVVGFPAVWPPHQDAGAKRQEWRKSSNPRQATSCSVNTISHYLQGRHLADVGEWWNPVLDGGPDGRNHVCMPPPNHSQAGSVLCFSLGGGI